MNDPSKKPAKQQIEGFTMSNPPETVKPIGTIKRSLQVWFSPQQLIDLSNIALCAWEDDMVKSRLKYLGITEDTWSELGLKLKKELDRIGVKSDELSRM